jgi:hypothetical protein
VSGSDGRIIGRGPVDDLDELVEHWTPLDDERELVAGKRGADRSARHWQQRVGQGGVTGVAVAGQSAPSRVR